MRDKKHIAKIDRELGLKAHQVKAAAALLNEGATIPFIARYRKPSTSPKGWRKSRMWGRASSFPAS
jgi:transcriptional accessory protein Tex/SPT6